MPYLRNSINDTIDQGRDPVTIDEPAHPEQEDDVGDSKADNVSILVSSLEDVAPPTYRARSRLIDTSDDDDDDEGTDHRFENSNAPSTKKKKSLGGKDEQGTKTPRTTRRSRFDGNYML